MPNCLPSGSIFPPGTLTVIVELIDIAGNTSTCTFEVPVPEPIQVVVDTVINETNSQANGAIQVSVSGGSGSFAFEWENEDGEPTFLWLDGQEVERGTDPNSQDTDLDSITDAWEEYLATSDKIPKALRGRIPISRS